jgi:gamma-glutamyltranspeptidase/glutathione hydrolase
LRVLGVFGLAAVLAGAALAREPASTREAIPIVAHKGAIASAYPLASEAGQEILAKGGNAFDAAVAVSAALAVVEPSSSGLGGGGFYLLHRQQDGFETMLDAREKAPSSTWRSSSENCH